MLDYSRELIEIIADSGKHRSKMEETGHEQHLTGAVGEELRAGREARGLGLADVAERTRIPQRHLAAIETSDYGALPAATYSAGFVRTYARLLGLDAPSLSQRFRAELAQLAPSEPRRQESYEPADPARVPSRGLVLIALLAVVVIGLGFLYWRGTTLENPAEVATAPSGEPVAAPPSAAAVPQATPAQPVAAATPAPTDTALLTAVEPVWLRITDADGTKLFQGMLQPGEHFQVPATATDPKLRTGRVTVIKVTVGPVAIPPLGPPETLVKDISLKADALLARTNATPAPTPAQ